MKVKVKSKQIVDGNTKAEELLDILLENRDLNKDFLEIKKTSDLGVEDFGVNKEDFEQAIKLIREFIKNKKNIVIYGDYDVDGVTATAILWRAIYPLNKNTLPFVPDREMDGYGINYQSFDNFCKKNKFKVDVLITIDNGVVAQEEIAKTMADGVKVIIIDHHKKNKDKIKADGLIHSTETTASVLAYLVAGQIDKKNYTDLAVTGLIADCGNVSNLANRSLGVTGIKKIKTNPNIGLATLVNMAGVKKTDISEETIGYIIGPRINAAGRMENATEALRLLCFDDAKKISSLAIKLEKNNKQRQTEQIEALKNLEEKEYKQKIIVETGNFHPGIIGLLAGKLTEKQSRPAIVVSNRSDVCKGSARSIDGFDITSFLRQDGDLFESLGGHPGAAGFSIKKTNYVKWQKKFDKRLKDLKIKTKKTWIAEAQMKLSALKLENYKIIEKLRPYGIGNDKPLFLFEKLKVIESRLVGGDQRHLKLKVDDPQTVAIESVGANGIAFGKGFLKKTIDSAETVNMLAYVNLNEWMGKKSVELLVKEIWIE